MRRALARSPLRIQNSILLRCIGDRTRCGRRRTVSGRRRGQWRTDRGSSFRSGSRRHPAAVARLARSPQVRTRRLDMQPSSASPRCRCCLSPRTGCRQAEASDRPSVPAQRLRLRQPARSRLGVLPRRGYAGRCRVRRPPGGARRSDTGGAGLRLSRSSIRRRRTARRECARDVNPVLTRCSRPDCHRAIPGCEGSSS